MTQGSAARLEVVRAEEQHAELVADFIRQVWNPEATAASVLAAWALGAKHNVAEPGIPPPTWIAVQEKVLGYVTTIPIRLWDGRQAWPAYWIKGLMVLPEFRGGPIGFLVLKAAAASLALTGGLAVAPPARRLFEAVGYRDLGVVPNWVRPIAPHRVIARLNPAELGLSRLPGWTESAIRFARRSGLGVLGGWVLGAALRGSAVARRLSALKVEAAPLDPAAAARELDALWLSIRTSYRSAVVRDAAYLLPRYPAGVGNDYVWLAARERGALVGIAIVRRPTEQGDARLRGIRVATLADVMYHPDQPAHGLALLGAAERYSRAERADVILAMSPSPDLAVLLRRQWYLPLGGNVHFLFRDKTAEGPAFAPALQDWWITRGDGQTDEAF